jgi:hypothetical protein
MKQAKLKRGRWVFRCFCGKEVSFQVIESSPQCTDCKTEYSIMVAKSATKNDATIKGVFLIEKCA